MLLGQGFCACLVYQILIAHRRLSVCLSASCLSGASGSGDPGVCIGQSECCNQGRNKAVGNFDPSETAPLASSAKVKKQCEGQKYLINNPRAFLSFLGQFGVFSWTVIFAVLLEVQHLLLLFQVAEDLLSGRIPPKPRHTITDINQ